MGRTLGRRYHLQRLLGVGGMGAVYEAIHRAMDRRVAVKVLLPAIADDGEFVRRFEREARAAAKVAGPGVPQLFDLDVDVNEGPFLVMEYLEGEGLDERLQRDETLPPAEAIALTIALLDTLGPVHARGIVHRDLKPANVFLAKSDDGEEQVKVLDFGIARLLFGPDSMAQLTQPGAAVGTPSYMAPEQLRGDPDVDGRADLYSLSIVLYQMLSGRLPHPQNSMQALIAAVITGMPVNLASVCPTLPQALVQAVHRGLAVSPADRFRDAAEMREALRTVDLATGAPEAQPAPAERANPSAPTALAVGAPSIPKTAPPPSFSVAPASKRSLPLVPILVAAVVVSLMIAGGFAAAFGFAVTRTEPRDAAPTSVAPVVAPQPVVTTRPLAPSDPVGWSPVHPADVADPIPRAVAAAASTDVENHVHEIVVEALRRLDDDDVDGAATVLRQLSDVRIPAQTHASEQAAIAFSALGDRLALRYGEDRDMPEDQVAGALSTLEGRIANAYGEAARYGSPRYAICLMAKQAALQLLSAHTLMSWPRAEGGALDQFASAAAPMKIEAARQALAPMIGVDLPGGAEACRAAAEAVRASLDEAP